MNNGVSFLLGLVVGAAAGGTAVYFVTKNKIEDRAADEIESYAQYAEEKIDRIRSKFEGPKETKTEESSDEDPVQEEEIPEHAKKYHKYSKATGETAQSVFEKKTVEKEIEEVTEGQKAIKKNPKLKDIDGIEELNEDDLLKYEEDENFSTVYLDYDVNTDELMWGSGTDNELIAEAKFNKGREELIGQFWRWAPDYVDAETGVGSFYVLNKNINKLFVVTVHFDEDGEFVEE